MKLRFATNLMPSSIAERIVCKIFQFFVETNSEYLRIILLDMTRCQNIEEN